MRALLPWVLILLCPPALADLFTAQSAYEKGDFDRAFRDYRELAELGQPLAQYNLAVMHAKGQGTRQSELNAYAWATLAAENGNAPAKALADQLRPLLAPGSEKIADDIRAPYRREALNARLMPQTPLGAGRDPACRPVTPIAPSYPWSSRTHGMQGEVYVEWTVAADGSGRDPRIVYAVPPGEFEHAVQAAVLRARYGPADPGAAASHCKLLVRFVLNNTPAGSYPRLLEYVEETRIKAEGGDVHAQVLYGMLLGLPQLRHRPADALPWFFKAAQAGSRAAQFQVGDALMTGWGCRADVDKGLVWLRKAAEADEPNAQVSLASYALRGAPDATATRGAMVWLERAAAHHDSHGTLYLAAVLAATPVTELRNPQRAMQLIHSVDAVGEDPTPFEIRAAAQAASGGFADSVRDQRKAIALATSLGWDLAPLKERLARYESHLAWYGNLLAL